VGSGTAQSYSVSPSVTHQFSPSTTGSASYRFDYNDLGGTSNQRNGVAAGLSHAFSTKDTGRIDYSLDVFDSTDEDTVVSNTATLGWARQFGPNTSGSVRLGPRFTNGDVGVEAGLDFAHRFRYATVSLAYGRTQSIATGQSGVQDVDYVTVGVGFPPFWRGYQASLVGSFTRSSPSSATSGQEGDTRTYRVGAQVARQINSWLVFRAFYQFSYEDGPGGNIPGNVVGAELAMSRLFPLK
jgi:hypothetical protein